MKFIQQLEMLDRLHCLIRRRGTGSPKSLAKRLEVSERTVYNLLDIMRDLGAEITYCRCSKTYYYEEPVEFQFLNVYAIRNMHELKGGSFDILLLQKLCKKSV